MKKVNYYFWVILLTMTLPSLSSHLHGQSFTYDNIAALSEISYFGGSRIDITHDVHQTIKFSNTAWSAPDISVPIAYSSGNKPRIKAVFDVNCTTTAEIWVKGQNADGYNFPPHKLIMENGKWVYSQSNSNPGWNSEKKFPSSTVGFWEDFNIDWYMSNSETASTWLPVGTSTHPMYVTYSTPLTLTVFHSVIYHGCKNAKGKTTPLDVVNSSYHAFANQDIQRIDNPTPLIYWNPNNANPLSSSICWQVDGLLLYGDGTCGSFADLFAKMILAQGIDGSDESEVKVIYANSNYELPNSIYNGEFIPDYNALNANSYGVFVFPPDYNGDGLPNDNFRAMFFVNDWVFPNDRSFYGLKNSIIVPKTVLPNFVTLPAADDTGIPGQNNPDPRAYFENHAIVKYNGKYYDPSYGSSGPIDAAPWETSSLAGFGTFGYMIIYQPDGSLDKKLFIWKRENNTSATQVSINP